MQQASYDPSLVLGLASTQVEAYVHTGGFHCETTALRNVFRQDGIDLSEEMLLGLGGGLGAVYFRMKMMPCPFFGGRSRGFRGSDGKDIGFIESVCESLNVGHRERRTASAKKGWQMLHEQVASGQPAFIYADMPYLPYTGVPPEAHFGAHSIVVFGLDVGAEMARVSDRNDEPQPLSFEDLHNARNSKHKPFPPKNGLYSFEFRNWRFEPGTCLRAALRRNAEAMLSPPIANLGVKAFAKLSADLPKWPKVMDPDQLLTALSTGFLYIELAGTGGGGLRRPYARFLGEASELLDDASLAEASRRFDATADLWSELAVLFLPDSVPSLREFRESIVEKSRIVIEGSAVGNDRVGELDGRAAELIRTAMAGELQRWPEGIPQMQDLLARIAQMETGILEDLRDFGAQTGV